MAQPAREVKSIQRAIVEVLSAQLSVHDSATAYKTGSSIILNASQHAHAKFLTKLDFSSFFPSINAATIARLLRASIRGIQDSDVTFVLDACLWYGDGEHALCVGAPSSPLLSNAAMYEFDVAASQVALASGCTYTRYSDDISISAQAPDLLSGVEQQIRVICRGMNYPNLVFNEEKRVAVGRGAAMRVTGLTLANDGAVTVGRLRKRGARAGVKNFLAGHMSLDRVDELKGELAFVLSVEPQYRDVLVSTYGHRIAELLPRQRDL